MPEEVFTKNKESSNGDCFVFFVNAIDCSVVKGSVADVGYRETAGLVSANYTERGTYRIRVSTVHLFFFIKQVNGRASERPWNEGRNPLSMSPPEYKNACFFAILNKR